MYVNKVIGSTYVTSLFPERPVIHFAPEVSTCCRSDLQVQKTRAKAVATLTIGEFDAKETILICSVCDEIYMSNELREIVPPRCKFGYDVLVYVGKAAFHHCRTDKQIIRELAVKKISISPSEVAYLEKRFIVYLALAHRQSSQRIKEALAVRGGYILHLDGTCEGDSPHLMSGLDEISGIVLHNVKIPSENADSIIPFLEKIKKEYGTPLAIVSDMGHGLSSAVKQVFQDVAHLLCHFHFLRDIGKDLLGKENDVIRKRLRKHKITSKLRNRARSLKQIIDDNPKLIDALHAGVENGQLLDCALKLAPVVSAYGLIFWALDGKNQGRGYGFPFDRSYVTFVQRLRFLYGQLVKLRDIRLRGDWRDNRPFLKLQCLLLDVVSDPVLRKAHTEIESKMEVFDKLRNAMRITVDDQHRGLNDNGEDAEIKTIEKGVEDFRRWLLNDVRYSKDNDYNKMVVQIDKYWEKLFADPIIVDTPQGKVTFQPQRTNNIMERFLRDIRRDHRRKSGVNSMSRKLKSMLADTPLVKNLENEEYFKIILNGHSNLEELFSEMDAESVREELRNSQKYSERIPSKIRQIMKKTDLPQIVMAIFRRQAVA